MRKRDFLTKLLRMPLVITLALLAVLVFSSSSFSEGESGGSTPALTMPAANENIANPVPLGVVRAVALAKAKELWGQVAPGEPIPLVDQDGNLAYYMCPFRKGAGPFLTYDQVMKGVKEGRQLREDASKPGVLEGRQADIPTGERTGEIQSSASVGLGTEKKLEDLAPPAPLTAPPGPLTPITKRERRNPSVTTLQDILKQAKAKELGLGEYGTVYVAATYDRYPIPLISEYLAPFYVSGDLAKEEADKALGGDSKLEKIYFLGVLGAYYEFSLGDKKETVHAYSLLREPVKRVKRKETSDPEQRKAYLQSEWAKHKEAAGVKEGGGR